MGRLYHRPRRRREMKNESAFAHRAGSRRIQGLALGGISSVTVSGTISDSYAVSYVLYAQQNQHMEVDLNGVGQDAALTIWGFSDGQPYIRSVTGATTFSFKLPMTEDYIIDIVPSGSMVVNYTLIVTVK